MNKITQVARIQREKSMESLLNIHPRHMRSVHLEGDFADTTSSLGFVLTPVAADALSRISSAFRSDSTQRAFRISGDYGSGKSAFGLALARISASVAGLACCLEPVVAAITSALVLGERLAPIQYMGVAIVIFAIIANVFVERRRTI